MTSIQGDTAAIVNRRLLPMVFLSLIMLQLDRINVGFAALEMNKAIGIGAEVFGFGAGIFFLGYAIFEIPSNLILQKVGAPRWIGRIIVTWGLMTCAMALVQGPVTFYLFRFLLGAAEAGFLPGIVLYLSSWYTSGQRASGLGILFTASAAAGMLGAPASAAMLQLSAFGLPGWQWMFLIQGGITVLVGIAFYLLMPREPENAEWLPEANRAWLRQAIAVEQAEKARSEASVKFSQCLKSLPVWVFSLSYFFLSVGFYSLFFWIPQVVRSAFTDLTTTQVGWISALPYLCAIVSLLVLGRLSDRSGNRGVHLGLLGVCAGIGLILGTQATPLVGYISLCVAVAAAWTYLAVFWPAPMGMLGGTAAAGGLALINSLGNIGGFVGPYVVGLSKELSGSFSLGIIAFASCLILSGLVPLAFASMFRRGSGTRTDTPAVVNPGTTA